MVDLTATTPCGDLLPLSHGRAELQEADLGVLTSLSPFGEEAALAAALQEHHGVGWPAPNRTTGGDQARCIWFGRGEALLIGPAPAAALADHAAVVDQSDGWAAFSLKGEDAVDVLARLVPVDLRARAFATGETRRTLLGHMTVSITRTGAEEFLILGFRSMAQTLVHEVSQAMETVASRR